MNDADLRGIFAHADAPCDRTDAVWDAVAGDLDASELSQVLAHVRSCGACAEAWGRVREALSESLAEGALPDAVAPQPAETGGTTARPWMWGGAAAALLAAAVLAMVLLPAGPEVESPWRRGTDEVVELELDDGAVAEGGILRFAPVGGAVSYEVVVTREDLSLVQQSVVKIPQVRLSTEVESGTVLLWRVVATRADASTVRSRTGRAVAP